MSSTTVALSRVPAVQTTFAPVWPLPVPDRQRVEFATRLVAIEPFIFGTPFSGKIGLLAFGVPFIEELAAFDVEDIDRVRSFLYEHAAVADALSEGGEVLRGLFPGDRFRLEAYTSPEEEAVEELAVFVLTAVDPDVALDRLNQFDESWWLERMQDYAGVLSFNVEYR